MKKICIFDWDVHMGDGSAQLFYQDDSILYISIHRWDNNQFYPAHGRGNPDRVGEKDGEGYTVLFPINQESHPNELISDKDYIYACETVLFPIIREFSPDLIMVSAGFDSAHGDELGCFNVTPIGYSWITHGLRKIQPKMCIALEGGYSLEALKRSSLAVLETLLIDPHDDDSFAQILEKNILEDDFYIDKSEKDTKKHFVVSKES